jgi:hypothetical protein
MTVLHYPTRALRADYLRGGAGFAMTAALLPFAEGELVSTLLLGGGALLFLAYGLRTWRRQRTRYALDDEGISTLGRRRVTLRWGELTNLTLRYYATKRDRTGGWMQLKLASGRLRLVLESSLEGFTDVARRAAKAARENGLALDPTTCENLLALGVSLGP